MESDFVQNAAFHDELAPRYDAHLTNSPYNILAREAFVELVTGCVSPGSTLLDFGCGTGIDAFQYAQKGYRVLAYDNSPGMVAQLERRCKAGIASGEITAWSEDYPSFLMHFPQSPAPSAAVANFAVLNSIRELTPLFDTFARHLAPPGWIVVSILNPIHWQRLKTPRWWLKALRDRDGIARLHGSTLCDIHPFHPRTASGGVRIPPGRPRQRRQVCPVRYCHAGIPAALLVGPG